MMVSSLACQAEARREKVHASSWNGFDYVEVGEDHRTLTVYFLGKAPADLTLQHLLLKGGRRIRDLQILEMTMHRDPHPRRDDSMVLRLDQGGDFSPYHLCAVDLDEGGHPIVDGEAEEHPRYKPFPGFDPRYACVEINFMAGCPSTLDCQTDHLCPPDKGEEPVINYLAKDYGSFRQLLLDRLALLLPDWQERHVPDLGITLVELLAYVGDYLSYYQDAVGTEAYLDTARQRISVRRHARLVDYRLHEGCNARAWICLTTMEDRSLDLKELYFITRTAALPEHGPSVLSHEDLQRVSPRAYEVFEPQAIVQPVAESAKLKATLVNPQSLWDGMQAERESFYLEWRRRLSVRTKRLLHDLNGNATPPANVVEQLKHDIDVLLALSADQPQIQIYPAHNTISFYTWGDDQCCLAKGATAATLRDGWDEPMSSPEPDPHCGEKTHDGPTIPLPKPTLLRLRVGDVLIFEEVLGSRTGNSADADPVHRHAVRLTRVEPGYDPLYQVPVVEIEWAQEDALPFPLCISSQLPAPECRVIEDVSVVHGNVVLVDHGASREDGCVVVPTKETKEECLCDGASIETIYLPDDVNIVLDGLPVTFSEPVRLEAGASGLLEQDPRQAVPWVRVASVPAGLKGCAELHRPDVVVEMWKPQSDLLNSGPRDPHFVVEIDNDRRAHVRFGDGELGAKPAAQTSLKPFYRVGCGVAGNVGAESITHLVFRGIVESGFSLFVRNPMPARGGVDPEPVAEAKLFAPHAFRTRLERAVIAEDYAQIAERNPNVQDAAAALRWTGSWYEAAVGIDPRGTEEMPDHLLYDVAGQLHRYRRIGHDLVVMRAASVPILLTLEVCVEPHIQRGHVESTLLDRFSNRMLDDGRLGFFHPDKLVFGQAVYLSAIVAAAQAVSGVRSVQVTLLARYGEENNGISQINIRQGFLKIGLMEIAQLDNDPNFPDHGTLTLTMRGGR